MTALARTPTAAVERVTVGGRQMYTRVWTGDREDARPIVLVHGLVVAGAYLVPTAERLAGPFRVYVPDQPGFGGSDPPAEPLSVAGLASALIAWLPAAGIECAAFLANSFGCQVTAELAMRRPDVVERLVLVSPTMDPTARTAVRQLRRWSREARTQSWALRRLLAGAYLRAGPRRALATFRHALADRVEDKLPFVAAPTLVVRGTADPIVSQRWAEEVARLLPDGRLAIVPHAPHAMNFDAPDALVAAVRSFLLSPRPAQE